MNREQKTKEVQALKEKFKAAKAIIFAQNMGLKVSEVTRLRKELKKVGVGFKIVKNRLAKLALKDFSVSGLESFFEGPTAMATSQADPVLQAKILVDFIKEHEALKLKGGILGGEILTPDKIKSLSLLPSREELYAKFLSCLLAPARGLVSVLAAVPKQLVTALEAIRKKKEI